MIETRTRRDTRKAPARAPAPAARGDRRRPWAAAALWSLLRAGALLSGPAGGPYDPAVIEDDRRRMAGRQAR